MYKNCVVLGKKTGPYGLLNTANLFTAMRLPLGVLGIYLFETVSQSLGVIVIGVAGLTDMADGLVARSLGRQSEFGAYLDPIIDKIFMLMIVIWSFTVLEGRALACAIIIIVVDGVIAITNVYYDQLRGVSMSTVTLGKWGIAIRMLALGSLLFSVEGFILSANFWLDLGSLLTGLGLFLGVVALYDYIEEGQEKLKAAI